LLTLQVMNAWATLGGTGTSMAAEPLAAKTVPLLQFVVMSTEHIVALQTAERDRLNKGITLLGGTTGRTISTNKAPQATEDERRRTRQHRSSTKETLGSNKKEVRPISNP
jgi:hypothetical protein